MKLLSILDDGTFYMEKVNELVGSESKWAEYKREQRQLEKQGNLYLNESNNIELDNVQKKSNENIGQCPIRDKSIENKIIDINSSCSKEEKNNDLKNEKLLQLKKLFNKYLKYSNVSIVLECYKDFSNMNIQVIECALSKSAEKDGSWLYAKTILKKWKKKDITTVNNVEKEKQEFEKSKVNVKYNSNIGFHGRDYEANELENMYDNL